MATTKIAGVQMDIAIGNCDENLAAMQTRCDNRLTLVPS